MHRGRLDGARQPISATIESLKHLFTVFQNLLPRALAWRTTVDTELRRYVTGLANWTAEVRLFIDLAYRDLFPEDTRELPQWEDQFALVTTGTEATRRARLDAAWQAQGGQSPDYIETQLQLADFAIWIHEWWASGPPYVARDPRDYTSDVLLGFYQCEGSAPWECFDSGPGEALAPHCDATLVNDPGYIVNLDLTRRAPPPIPSDAAFWPYFLYFGGETFGDPAYVDADRVDELKAKILSLRPTQQWIVLMVEPLPAMASMLYRFAIDRTPSIYESGTVDDIRRVEAVPNIGSLGGDTVQATSASRPTGTTFPEGRAAYFSGSQKMASDAPAATWNRLHDAAGVATIVMRFRALDAVGNHGLLNTSGAVVTNPGIDIRYNGGFLDVVIGKGGGASQSMVANPAGEDTYTFVIVKNGLNVDLYFTDMITPDFQITLTAPSASDATAALTLGGPTGTGSDAWIPEVLIYDFAATQAQREAAVAYLDRWVLEPTQAEYIALMVEDGLAHFFDADNVNPFGADAWTDTITGNDMLLDGAGSRSLTTLDGAPALSTTAPFAFHEASAIADGTNKGFTIYAYAQTPGGPSGGGSLWQFDSSVGADYHGMVELASSMRIERNANGSLVTSGTIGLSTSGRHYAHVFRAGADTANLFRRDDLASGSVSLNANPLSVDEWRLIPGATANVYAFLALFDRALGDGDVRALQKMIEREI